MDEVSDSLRVIYQDDTLIAIDKPAGLLVHRTNLDRHETRFAVQLLRNQLGRHVFPVHRLDKGTSGILLFTFDGNTAAELATQFEEKTTRKTYLALVRGYCGSQQIISHPLKREPENYDDHREAVIQDAETWAQRIGECEMSWPSDQHPSSRYSLIALEPRTGRRHQLRRHMKHTSHPIIGDATHGKGRDNRQFAAQTGISRLMLANIGLHVFHPKTGQPLTLACPVEPGFRMALTQLGLEEKLSGVETMVQQQGYLLDSSDFL